MDKKTVVLIGGIGHASLAAATALSELGVVASSAGDLEFKLTSKPDFSQMAPCPVFDGTLTVERNFKTKGSHPQPFYRKGRW